jgi:hypothetical protein
MRKNPRYEKKKKKKTGRSASLDQRIESSIGYELRTDVYMETRLYEYAERCYKPACEHGLADTTIARDNIK